MGVLLHISDTHFGTEQAPVVEALVALAAQALESPGENAEEKVTSWERENQDRLARLRDVLGEIEGMPAGGDAGAELAALSVALRTMRSALTE